MLNSDELHEVYEGLKLNNVNKYDYVLTGRGPGGAGAGAHEPHSGSGGLGRPQNSPCPGLIPGLSLLQGDLGLVQAKSHLWDHPGASVSISGVGSGAGCRGRVGPSPSKLHTPT